MASPQTSLFSDRTRRGGTSIYRHPALALYREVCGYKPNQRQRGYIMETVGQSEKALVLYREVLEQFMSEGRPPQRVDWTLERFENAQPPVIVGSQEEAPLPIEEKPYVGPVVADDSFEGRTWRAVLAEVRLRLSAESFESWFEDLRLISIDQPCRKLRVLAPDAAVRDWVASNYISVLEDVLDAVGWDEFSITWAVGPTAQTEGELVNA